MPRVNDGGGGGRFHVPGVCERLLLKDCEQVYEPNPCRVLVDDWRKANDEYEKLKAEGLRQAGVLFEERMKAGEPIVVAGWRVGTHKALVEAGAPEWLMRPAIYGGASVVRVYVDDTLEPAEFYGDQIAGTGMYERVPVPPGATV
jgi:hypothetical protein